MLIRDGLRPHLWQLYPKRDFRLLIDPNCLNLFSAPLQSEILQFILDLRLLNPLIHIQLLTSEKRGLQEPLFEVVSDRIQSGAYVPTRLGENDPRAELLKDNPTATHEKALCALAIHEKVDGLVTMSLTFPHLLHQS